MLLTDDTRKFDIQTLVLEPNEESCKIQLRTFLRKFNGL
jgi:hypothetical protein